MNIGIVSPFNPSEFSDYLGLENVPSINESARAIHIYVKELLEAGHSITIFTTFTSSNNKHNVILQKNNLKIYIISRHYIIPYVGAFIRLVLHKRIARALNNEIDKLDVLHAQWTYEYALATSKFVKRIPVFCTIRDWCPVIMKGQNKIVDKIYWKCSYYTFKKVITNEQIHFIANSSYTLKQVNTMYPAKDVRLIYNPIYRKDINDNRNSYPAIPVFVTISNGCGKLKNIYSLVLAFHEFRQKYGESELLLIGGSFIESNPEIQGWGKSGLLDGVKLMGRRTHEEINRALDNCSAMVHPSLEETFGNVLVEGMSRRIPVVGGSESGAVPEVLGYGECGILCNVRNPKEICKAMEDSINPLIRNLIVEKATSRLKELYSSDAIVNKHIQLFNEFLQA